jgi:hypothetical protein
VNENSFSKPSSPSYYPSIFADPAEKLTKEYNLATCRAIYYNNWANSNNAYGNADRSRMIDNRDWSNGNFNVQSFVGGKRQKNHTSKNPLLRHLDFDPVTEQPKYRDIVVGYLEELDFDISASSINPMAKAKKEDERLREIAMIKAKQAGITDQMNQTAGRPLMPESKLPFAPESEEQINNYYNLGGAKEIAELEIELGNKIAQNDSDWKVLKKMLLEDAFDYGRVVVDTYYDKTGRIKYKYVDPVNCGVEDFRGHYLKRPNRIWYIELVTVHEFLIDSNGQFTLAQAEEIAKVYENKFGNPTWNNNNYQGVANYVNTDSTYGYFWYNYKVPRMTCYWEELNYYKQSTETKYNKEVIMPADYTAKSGTKKVHNNGIAIDREIKVDEFAVHNYHMSRWIVNTDYIYDYGPVPYQARDPLDIRFALCPLKYYRVANQPIGERVKAFTKKIWMTWQKIDNEVANKIPSGYKINVKALENMSLGQGETFTVKHAIELVNETGRMVYADEAAGDDFGRTIKKDPIEVFDTSTAFMRAVQAWQMLINFYEERIMKVTGLNEMTDGSNPNTQTGATLAKLAAQGTKNSFSQLASGIMTVTEKLAIDVSERIRLIVQEQGEYNGYADAMGSGILEATRISPAVVPHRYAIKVTARPTAKEREEFKAAIYQSFSNMAGPESGGLWVSAALKYQEMVNNGTNDKIIRIMMEAEQKKMLDILQQQKMQAIQEQAKLNSQNTMDAAKAQLYLATQMSAIKQQEFTHEINETIRLEQAKTQFKTENQAVIGQQKADHKQQEIIVKSTVGA